MDDKCPRVQSNEEIIEELTKDLETSCIKSDVESGTNETKQEKGRGDNDPWEDIEHDRSESTEKIHEIPEDFVDEEALKDREVGLMDEEKQKLKERVTELKNEGNTLFKSEEYQKAMLNYTQALQICPLAFNEDRAILYANRAAAKAKYMDDKESAIKDCTKAIELNPNYVKAYVRRAQLYEEKDKLDEALEDFKKVLTYDPGHKESNCAIIRLPPMIQERNEKLKTEMLGKLKDLGNLVLKPFGLSTDNFQLEANPGSEGYSVKFRQNPR